MWLPFFAFTGQAWPTHWAHRTHAGRPSWGTLFNASGIGPQPQPRRSAASPSSSRARSVGKPGIGYPKNWEDQGKWKGGWARKADGRIEPRIGGKLKVLAKIFANPDLPEIDDYYEPFTFDYEHLKSAPESKAMPTARPRSLVTGKRMDKIEWGPNWEEILGGEFAKRSKDANCEGIQKKALAKVK